MVLEVI